MSLSAATSVMQTVLAYFSPTKSPYYSVIAFGTSALVMSAPITFNWPIIFFPVVLLLFYSTLLSIFDKPDFDEKEYNDQIKFARAFSLSVAVLCLVVTGRKVEPNLVTTENYWYFWLAYLASIAQLILFSFYTYVYSNLRTRPVNQNFVQLALITSTFLIGAVYANISYHSENISKEPTSLLSKHYLYIFWCLSTFWLITVLVWLNHLRKTIIFKVLIPEDAHDGNG